MGEIFYNSISRKFEINFGEIIKKLGKFLMNFMRILGKLYENLRKFSIIFQRICNFWKSFQETLSKFWRTCDKFFKNRKEISLKLSFNFLQIERNFYKHFTFILSKLLENTGNILQKLSANFEVIIKDFRKIKKLYANLGEISLNLKKKKLD